MIGIRQQEVNVNRLNLIEILKKNRDSHNIEFSKAFTAYTEALVVELSALLELAKKRDGKTLRIETVKPSNFYNEYVKVIDMLEMSVDENIRLDGESFRAYVKDEWSWKNNFSSTINSNDIVFSKYLGG